MLTEHEPTRFLGVTDMTFDEYREQDVITLDDGDFFDSVDRALGIDPDEVLSDTLRLDIKA